MSCLTKKIYSVIEKIKLGYKLIKKQVGFPCHICEKNANENQNAVFLLSRIGGFILNATILLRLNMKSFKANLTTTNGFVLNS